MKSSKELVGYIDSFNGYTIDGWAADGSEQNTSINLFLNDVKLSEAICNIERKDIKKYNPTLNYKCGFKSTIKYVDFFKASEQVKGDLKLTFSDKDSVNTKPVSFLSVNRPDIVGSIEKTEGNTVFGWFMDKNYPDVRLLIDVYLNGGKLSAVRANLDTPYKRYISESAQTNNYYFNLDLSEFAQDNKELHIDLYLLNTTHKLNKAPIVLSPTFFKISAIEKLQEDVKKMLMTVPSDEKSRWLNQTFLPNQLDKLRKNTPLLADIQIDKKIFITNSEVVDIIIPVYDGYQETLNCITSLLKSKNKVKTELVVINDKSPDPEITKILRKFHQKGEIKLIENKRNQGFVRNANIGMQYSKDRDVILLNSDTEVTNYWADRLIETAYAEINIGTVTPFSNNATICSYPNFIKDNNMLNGFSLQEVADLFYSSNKNELLDLPTGHGFCMLIKRTTLNEVGLFDEQNFGKGYAEENDFCMRAARLGWRSVMSCHSFVRHYGAVSFGTDSKPKIYENLKKLNKIYPDYTTKVHAFIKLDPPRKYRNKVSLEVVKKLNNTLGSKRGILFISHSLGGGTKIAIDDISKALEQEGTHIYVLESGNDFEIKLYNEHNNIVFSYNYKTEFNEFLALLKSLNIFHINYHHTLQFDKSIWDLPKLLNVPYDITVHDYYSVCPRVNFTDGEGKYCKEPGVKKCNSCIAKDGVHAGSYLQLSDFKNDVSNWREFYFEKFNNARKIFTPSIDAKTRILKYFKLKNVVDRPHPEVPVKTIPKKMELKQRKLKLAFLGAIGVHKGYNVLVDLANHIEKDQLDIDITVIGITCNNDVLKKNKHVKITGEYAQKALPDMLKQINPDVILLLSVWPETFSYTASEAIRNSIPIVVYKIGAFKERVSSNKWIKEIEMNATPQEIIREITQFLNTGITLPEATVGVNYHSLIDDFYELN